MNKLTYKYKTWGNRVAFVKTNGEMVAELSAAMLIALLILVCLKVFP